jgi:hypothetical protein
LDTHGVGHFAHYTAQRVDLTHQVALRDASNRRIAGHLRDQV